MTKQKYKRQPRKFYERPLTEEEAQFAADHLNFVYWFLNNKNLDENEWFDVVIFRYLLAVKQYICISDLQRYSFACIAYKAMTSAITNECRSQKIRIQTVSLYHPAPGTDNLVYADMITTENLNFIPYIYEKDDTMRSLAPKACGKPKGKEVKAIEKFLDSDEENLCLEYETAQQARSKTKTIGSHRKRLAKLHIYYQAHLRGKCIYITKGKGMRAT